jgi:hypothetical protein
VPDARARRARDAAQFLQRLVHVAPSVWLAVAQIPTERPEVVPPAAPISAVDGENLARFGVSADRVRKQSYPRGGAAGGMVEGHVFSRSRGGADTLER